jgi:hypothetical protein
VAHPHQSPLRSARSHSAIQKTLGTHGHQPRPELDRWSVRHARISVGNVAGSPNVPYRRYYGRDRAMYCHGHGMEPTRWWGRRLLCSSRRREFGVADHTLLAICGALHRRDWLEPIVAPPVWRSGNIGVDCTSVLVLSMGV